MEASKSLARRRRRTTSLIPDRGRPTHVHPCRRTCHRCLCLCLRQTPRTEFIVFVLLAALVRRSIVMILSRRDAPPSRALPPGGGPSMVIGLLRRTRGACSALGMAPAALHPHPASRKGRCADAAAGSRRNALKISRENSYRARCAIW
jgi:hypothetical protein